MTHLLEGFFSGFEGVRIADCLIVSWRQVGTQRSQVKKLLSVHCCSALHRNSIRRMRYSVVSIVRSQRAINPLISRWAVRNTPLSTCSSNPMSSRSSMVSSNWYCNFMAKSLTRWTKRSCWSKARTWLGVRLFPRSVGLGRNKQFCERAAYLTHNGLL